MDRDFDEALNDLIDEFMLVAEKEGDEEETLEDIISALELKLLGLREQRNANAG
ncbi:hypothetical protein [Sinorhizobium fredii]|uniref:hypothetical protein n=1 Tax=Rhizobium fredii TaxID=380 RepID=UPI0004B88064|nr:hypothetical protein [Sinorhizobium fredii]